MGLYLKVISKLNFNQWSWNIGTLLGSLQTLESIIQLWDHKLRKQVLASKSRIITSSNHFVHLSVYTIRLMTGIYFSPQIPHEGPNVTIQEK